MNSSTPSSVPNHLGGEHSPYLLTAAHQPVEWYPWGDEAFARAEAEGKPILLDIGAVWCHWCHVMDGESYENPEIAAQINSDFIAVKVDRDERPDVDARYQRAVQAMTGQGGWPLTVFLTPAGVPFYGGTYFPPESRHNRPGFPHVLHSVAGAFREQRHNVEEQGTVLLNFLSDAKQPPAADSLSQEAVDQAIASIHAMFDERNGGFGSAPKFPHPSAIDLLITHFGKTHDETSRRVIITTLRKMADGGVYDQLAGGFHRYSTDAKWIVPHFEKMLYDNTELLRNYLYAYAVFGDSYFREIAEGIISWMNTVLADAAQGGFAGSQDADITFGDDGAYFTWRMTDAQEVLTPEEFSVAQLYYNIFQQGEMHIDPTQNVLFVDRSIEEIAESLHHSVPEVRALLEVSQEKLLAARLARTTPFVDRTIYLGWNAMAVTAYLDAAEILKSESCKAMALATLDRLLRKGFTDSGYLRHTLAPQAPVNFLDDYAHLVQALFRVFEATNVHSYFDRAVECIDNVMKLLYDGTDGGFFDKPSDNNVHGILSIVNKSIQDSPSPSGNAVMCRNLLKAHWWTNNAAYLAAVEKTLKRFLPEVLQYGLFGAECVHAVHEYLDPPTHVAVVGAVSDERTRQLLDVAHEHFVPGMIVTWFSAEATNTLPSIIRSMQASVSVPAAFVCSGLQCSPPCQTADTLRQLLAAS